jgi:hypothetical protein
MGSALLTEVFDKAVAVAVAVAVAGTGANSVLARRQRQPDNLLADGPIDDDSCPLTSSCQIPGTSDAPHFPSRPR